MATYPASTFIDSPKVLVILLEIKKLDNELQVVQCNTKIVKGSKRINFSDDETKSNEAVFLLEIVDNQQKIVYTHILNESFTETLEFVNNQGVFEKKQTEKKLAIALLQLPFERNFKSLHISSINSAKQKQLIYQTNLKPID